MGGSNLWLTPSVCECVSSAVFMRGQKTLRARRHRVALSTPSVRNWYKQRKVTRSLFRGAGSPCVSEEDVESTHEVLPLCFRAS